MKNLKRISLAIPVLLYASLSSAFETVSDEELSATEGQSGITFSITPPAAGLTATSIVYHDANVAGGGAGIPASIVSGYANQGDLVLSTVGLQGCSNNTVGACTALGAGVSTFAVDVDATGDIDTVTGGNQAALRVNAAWGAGVGKMRVKLAKLSLQNATAANSSDILNSVNGFFDLIPASGTPTITVLLGNEQTTGHMMTFSNANFGTVDFGTLQVLDKSGGAGRNMNFTFQLENFDLSNTTVDVVAGGMVLTTPNLTAMNMVLRNIIVGNTATTIGSVGVLGLNISGLTVTVTGKI